MTETEQVLTIERFLPCLLPARGSKEIESVFAEYFAGGTYHRKLEHGGLHMSASGDYAASWGWVTVSGWMHPRLRVAVGYKSVYTTIYYKSEPKADWKIIIDLPCPESMTWESAVPDHTVGVLDTVTPFNFRPAPDYAWEPKALCTGLVKEKEDIRKIHEIIDKEIENLSAAGFASFYHPEGQLITPAAPVANGPTNIEKFAGEAFGLPRFILPIVYYETVVAKSCDLAFTFGEIAMRVEDKYWPGDYMIVYKKSDNGQWRGLLDITCPIVVQRGLFLDQ
ncbi:hypothetical protein B0J13DRAFT_642606 [Dactylonectria estremocensis]|uniref:DUF4440 domain-containing protein n=1 Tax=Dactylonectria estremocensis TaxID=1079267 RepID=A0A9P9IQT6_9HYPO|nr:hypothetical protein B0J13DRAFT_642606 [Dactylonectria estremocensis]